MFLPTGIGRMMRDGISLKEVVIKGNSGYKEIQMRSAQNTLGVTRGYVEDNFGGSLMQTLERLPGVKAMAVGSGASKPVIRGLGFNRVLVAETASGTRDSSGGMTTGWKPTNMPWTRWRS